MDIDQQIATRIRAARLASAMTQKDLAMKIGMTRSSIANIEASRQAVLASTLVQISQALDVSVSVLVGQAVRNDLATEITGLQRRISGVLAEMVDGLERTDRELGRVVAIVSASTGGAA